MAQDDKSKFRAGIHRAEENAGLGSADETGQAFSQAADRATSVTSEAAGAIGEGVNRATERAGKFAQQSVQSLTIMSDVGRVMASNMQDLSREVMSIAEESMRHNMDGLNTLASCRTLPELMAAQAGFVRQSMERFVESQRRLAAVTMRLADEARGQMTRLSDEGAEAARKVA